MTNEEIYEKHSMVFNNDSHNSNAREHTNISIDFTEKCLHEVLKEYKTEGLNLFKKEVSNWKTLDEIILDKIKQLKNDKETNK